MMICSLGEGEVTRLTTCAAYHTPKQLSGPADIVYTGETELSQYMRLIP